MFTSNYKDQIVLFGSVKFTYGQWSIQNSSECVVFMIYQNSLLAL